MFSVEQKRAISDAVQKILRCTEHPELPTDEIQFQLIVKGAEPWSYADIRNNGAVLTPGINPHNEVVAQTMKLAKIILCPDCRDPWALDKNQAEDEQWLQADIAFNRATYGCACGRQR